MSRSSRVFCRLWRCLKRRRRPSGIRLSAPLLRLPDVQLELLPLARLQDLLRHAAGALDDDQRAQLAGHELDVLEHHGEQLGDGLVGAERLGELEDLEARGQAGRVQAGLAARLAEELRVAVEAQVLDGLEVAQAQDLAAGQGGVVDGDGLDGLGLVAQRHDVLADLVGALLQLRGRVGRVVEVELAQALWELHDVRERVVVDVTLDEVQRLEGGAVWPLHEVEASLVQPGAADYEGLEGWVGEDVDVLAKVPVAVVWALVEEGAGLEAGEVEGPVEEGTDAVQQLDGDGDVEGLEVGHGGEGAREAVDALAEGVGAGGGLLVEGAVEDEVRQLGAGVLELDVLDHGATARAAVERLAEDEVVLGRLEEDAAVEDAVGQCVVFAVEDRDVADGVPVLVGQHVEDEQQQLVGQQRESVGLRLWVRLRLRLRL